ncbi:hypothetical protein Pmar_PMAR015549, partial [Perkinsus marinus ATCC 50983]
SEAEVGRFRALGRNLRPSSRPGTPSVPRPSGDLAQPPTNHGGENVPAAPAQVPSPSGAPVGGPK